MSEKWLSRKECEGERRRELTFEGSRWSKLTFWEKNWLVGIRAISYHKPHCDRFPLEKPIRPFRLCFVPPISRPIVVLVIFQFTFINFICNKVELTTNSKIYILLFWIDDNFYSIINYTFRQIMFFRMQFTFINFISIRIANNYYSMISFTFMQIMFFIFRIDNSYYYYALTTIIISWSVSHLCKSCLCKWQRLFWIDNNYYYYANYAFHFAVFLFWIDKNYYSIISFTFMQIMFFSLQFTFINFIWNRIELTTNSRICILYFWIGDNYYSIIRYIFRQIMFFRMHITFINWSNKQ
jgi:hypothetical protein